MLRLLLILPILLCSAAHAAWDNTPGSLPTGVVHSNFNSAVANTAVGFNIYLPPNYATSTDHYPVIYHLHAPAVLKTTKPSSPIHSTPTSSTASCRR